MIPSNGRRGFLRRLPGFAALAGASSAAAQAQQTGTTNPDRLLPQYARAQSYRSLKQSTYDRSGGNADYRHIEPGGTLEVFNAQGAGVITHVWFTIAARSSNHLKELVLRAWWDGNDKPSVETPIGDFFGLNLGQYVLYESAFLACSPGKSLNCYFTMPYRRSARMTVENQGREAVDAFYSNIDYKQVAALPDDALYFHAQYRQAAPCVPAPVEHNLDGRNNYVFCESRGRGHLMGVTWGILQNADGWWGEGDEMIFVDDESRPLINGTGSEDYLLASWDFGGRDTSVPFAHHFYGAPLIAAAERAGGRYHVYRWHGDNPVTFTRYLKHTIEHGHGNDRGDNFFSVGYWYQAEPYTDFPALPTLAERIPKVRTQQA